MKELKVGDLVCYRRPSSGEMRFTFITRIEGNNVWGWWCSSICRALKKENSNGEKTTDISLVKHIDFQKLVEDKRFME